MKEDFKPIVEYEGHYEINSEGVIRSLKFGKRKILKRYFNTHNYPYIHLFKDGKCKSWLVHRLVWMSFIGPIPDGIDVLHGEGNDSTNSSIEYLSLGTHSDNMGRDRDRDGSDNRGSNSGTTKLTEEQVRYIRLRLRDNECVKTLRHLFDVSGDVISCIKLRKTWRHVSI